MGNKDFIFWVVGLVLLSILVIAEEHHDVVIDASYGVNGIKIRYNATDITDDPACLIIGNSYELRTKGENPGDYDESVYFNISIANSSGNIIEYWHHTYSLDINQSKYVPNGWEVWNTSGLSPGIYTIIASASIQEEEGDYSNNLVSRAVRLDYDNDGDGVADCFDKCPDSKPGEEVDQNGCDIFQFCEPFYCGFNCFYADWRNNENGVKYPHDCTVVIISREGDYEPKCVPLSCAD